MVLKIRLFFVIIAATSSVWSLKCYNCNSEIDDGCEPLDKNIQSPKNCEANADICYSMTFQKIVGNITLRGCHKSSLSDICHKLLGSGRERGVFSCQTCKYDGCNESPDSSKNSVVVVAFAFLTQWFIT